MFLILDLCKVIEKIIHIVFNDIPYPVNYGGAVDCFHTLRCLSQKGYAIIFHCFQYGQRQPAPELEKFCFKTYYYKREMSIGTFLSITPQNVVSRNSEELKQNLLKDSYPIICEVLHTCFLLEDTRFKDRKIIYREVNIEHDYYRHLSHSEKRWMKKIHLILEAFKLKKYEKIISKATSIASVSLEDMSYLQSKYSPEVKYIPCFHSYDDVKILPGSSDYILYHGNLGVSENYEAAMWLITHVFSKMNYRVIIAGLNPPEFLRKKIENYHHIELRENCSNQEMTELIENAQIHTLYTSQPTGLKLKLLNVLYRGRFVIANPAMLAGTKLHDACIVVDTPEEFIKAVKSKMSILFSDENIQSRIELVKEYDNEKKTNDLISLLS